MKKEETIKLFVLTHGEIENATGKQEAIVDGTFASRNALDTRLAKEIRYSINQGYNLIDTNVIQSKYKTKHYIIREVNIRVSYSGVNEYYKNLLSSPDIS